jgi:hypothetical protein
MPISECCRFNQVKGLPVVRLQSALLPSAVRKYKNPAVYQIENYESALAGTTAKCAEGVRAIASTLHINKDKVDLSGYVRP